MRSWLACLAVLMLVLPAGCRPVDSRNDLETRRLGISESEILIGASLALSGHAGYLGTETLHGAMAYIRHINAAGGIHGRRLKVIAYDDGYDPPRCLYNTQRLLIEDQVFALFCYVGTPTTVKILPLVAEARIPLVGMFTGANALREPLQPYVINVRASYYQETGAAVQHLVEDLGLRRIGVFYQYDAYGFDGLRGTELALKTYGLVPVATGTYIRGTADVAEGLARIQAAAAEAVVMIGTYDPCARFILSAREQGYRPVFHNVSFVGAEALVRLLGDQTDGVIITQVVPPPEPSPSARDLWGIREYIDLLGRYYPDDAPNFVGLEGYLNARVLVEGLRRAGRDLDREGFIRAIESIHALDLGVASPLSFSASDHQGLERVYLTYVKDGSFQWLQE
ncbi:MAG: ABC transporter substrate-binding protein [Desulfosarcinaceae bacterium]|nr:ABC transporter substrate-binding protein [Desulfosarcinaceae bacterium]